MMKVFKYSVPMAREFTIEMPDETWRERLHTAYRDECLETIEDVEALVAEEFDIKDTEIAGLKAELEQVNESLTGAYLQEDKLHEDVRRLKAEIAGLKAEIETKVADAVAKERERWMSKTVVSETLAIDNRCIDGWHCYACGNYWEKGDNPIHRPDCPAYEPDEKEANANKR